MQKNIKLKIASYPVRFINISSYLKIVFLKENYFINKVHFKNIITLFSFSLSGVKPIEDIKRGLK